MYKAKIKTNKLRFVSKLDKIKTNLNLLLCSVGTLDLNIHDSLTFERNCLHLL